MTLNDKTDSATSHYLMQPHVSISLNERQNYWSIVKLLSVKPKSKNR